MKLIILAVGIATLCFPSGAFAGVGLFDGTSEDDWVRARTAILIARIDSIDPADPDAVGELKLTLLPQATLGGAFDCGAEPKIVASSWYATGGDSAIFGEHPRKGTLVLVLVCMYESEDFWRVPNENCPLLPNGQPLYVLKDMNDPAIPQTLARIQKARAIAKQKRADAAAQRKKK